MLNSALLEMMTQGVIFLDDDGDLTDYNHAALPWLPHFQDKTVELGATIKKITDGTLSAPVNITSVFTAAHRSADYYLCTNEPRGFVIFIAERLPPSGLPLASRDTLLSVLNEDLQHELSAFRHSLAQLVAPSSIHTDFEKRTRRLSRLLVAMEHLGESGQPGTSAINPSASVSGAEPRGRDTFPATLASGATVHTGAVAQCATCLFPRQAEMYARDLVLLLPHRNVESTVSSEELDYLAQLTSGESSAENQ